MRDGSWPPSPQTIAASTTHVGPPQSKVRSAVDALLLSVAREAWQARCQTPRPSRHTPVRSRTQDRDAPARLGLREASAETRLPTDRQVPRCRRERSRGRPNRFTRGCSLVRFRPSRAAAPQVCGDPHQHLGQRRQHRRGCRSRRQPRARCWRSEDPESCASRTNVTGGRRPTVGAVGPRASTVAPRGLGAGDRRHGPLPLSTTRQRTPRARLRRPALWHPTCCCSRREAGRGGAGRGDVPTCPCPGLGRLPTSWHGAGGLRTLGRAVSKEMCKIPADPPKFLILSDFFYKMLLTYRSY